jgi:hypothetical protein
MHLGEITITDTARAIAFRICMTSLGTISANTFGYERQHLKDIQSVKVSRMLLSIFSCGTIH